MRGSYEVITKPRLAQMGRYSELSPDRYTSIIQTRPEVDITDESLDTSCVLNRSRNTSLEDKGIRSALFIPLLVIIAVLYVTTLPYVDTTMEKFKSDIESLRHKLAIISADKTGMADFALESAGAEIVSEFTSRGLSSDAVYHTVSARTALQPDVNPGNCFAFGGDQGTIGIRLSRRVVVQNVTIEHIPKEISLNGNIDSAPRDFLVFGINTNAKVEMGRFTYQVNGLPIQTFRVANDVVYSTVQFEFTSNWGAEHTCVYRLRVHGAHN